MLMKFDVTADIVPGKSLGGVNIGASITDFQDDLQQLYLPPRPQEYKLVSPFEAYYTVAKGRIIIAVDVRNGKIYKVCAMFGYTGLLFGKLRVGMNIKEAMSLEPRLYYDEAEELLFIKGIKGLSLGVPASDPYVHEVPSMRIHNICVELEDILSLRVCEGRW
jgi:hypothetical protein